MNNCLKYIHTGLKIDIAYVTYGKGCNNSFCVKSSPINKRQVYLPYIWGQLKIQDPKVRKIEGNFCWKYIDGITLASRFHDIKIPNGKKVIKVCDDNWKHLNLFATRVLYDKWWHQRDPRYVSKLMRYLDMNYSIFKMLKNAKKAKCDRPTDQPTDRHSVL